MAEPSEHQTLLPHALLPGIRPTFIEGSLTPGCCKTIECTVRMTVAAAAPQALSRHSAIKVLLMRWESRGTWKCESCFSALKR